MSVRTKDITGGWERVTRNAKGKPSPQRARRYTEENHRGNRRKTTPKKRKRGMPSENLHHRGHEGTQRKTTEETAEKTTEETKERNAK